jgi:hypothetical protein
MKATEIALKAAELVGGDRADSYGDARLNHEKIASVWNGILMAANKGPLIPLDAHDVANMMEGLKIARRYTGPFNPENYIDGCGYSAIAGQIASEMEKP